MTDIVLETIRALVLFGIVAFLWNAGRNRFEQSRNGWNLIITGFGLLLFGSLLDISDNFDSLNRFIIVGDTEIEAILEKFVGFLGGFVFLAIGLFKWIPGVQALSDLVSSRTQDLEDINEKLHEEIIERKQAEKVKQEFTSTVSHELRTPLTSIKGALSLIQSGAVGQLPDKVQSMIDIADTNSDRLLMLINDILDMDKVQAGKMELQMEPMDIVSLIEEAVEANRGYGDEHGVTFVKALVDEKIMLNGDRDRLMQVLSNLMSNAAKFSPDGERVELSATHDGNTIRVAVKDNGPGLPEEYRGSIFEKFTQVDTSNTRTKGGTGLGLSIAKAIIEQHGGAIDFDSEVGVGSTFFFTLPILK